MSRRAVLTTVEVLMVLSVPAFFIIPFGQILGLDFQNLAAFHDCFARDDPWSASGAECGDLLGRDMYYPPLLYWSFAWTRFLPLSAAYLVWAVVIAAGVLLATMAWVPRNRWNGASALFAVLLLLQFPALFAIERGNNDVLVLILWTVAMHLFVSARLGWSGSVAGFAAAAKLYPVFAAAVVGAGLLWHAFRERTAWRPLVRFAAGGLAAIAVAVSLTFDQTRSYLVDEGAALVGTQNPLSPWSHTLHGIAPGGSAWILSLPLLAIWGIASARRLTDEPAMTFAGGLAISTYFGSVSNDYNLITTYPLLAILFVRSLDARSEPAHRRAAPLRPRGRGRQPLALHLE